jgi:hypothetical protein
MHSQGSDGTTTFSDVSDEPKPVSPGRAIARRDLEAVIRRAAELSYSEGDAEERLSEDEVVRIASELGLQPKHVRQALYEQPSLKAQPTWSDRYYGPAIVSASRSVPGEATLTTRRVEDYLTTREYLQIIRRVRDQVLLEPAEDAISSLARGLLRPGSRHHISRASRVLLTVAPLDEATSHVRIEADLSEQRRSYVRSGMALGGVGGLIIGSVGAGLVDLALAPGAITAIGQVVAFGGGLAASVTAGIMSAGARFRARVAHARREIDALLDRAESGGRLDPPPAPWRRRIQMRLFGG